MEVKFLGRAHMSNLVLFVRERGKITISRIEEVYHAFHGPYIFPVYQEYRWCDALASWSSSLTRG